MSIDLVWDGARYTCTPVTPEPTPEPEPRTFPLVTPYSQNDPRWRAQEYAGGETFGRNGCLVTCVAMILSLAYPERIEPPVVAYRLRKAGAFNGAFLGHPSRIAQAFERLEWGGVEHWRSKPADISGLRRELVTYGATICEVKWNPNGPSPEKANQHFLVVDFLGDDDAEVVDPWDGERKLLSETRYRLQGWDVARTLYGMRMVRARG